MEYLIIHRGKRGMTIEYELLYDGKGKDGSLFLMGLIDIDKLKSDQNLSDKLEYDGNKSGLKAKINRYDGNKPGVSDNKAGPGRPQVAPKSGGGRGVLKPLVNKVLPFFLEKNEKIAQGG